MHACNACKITQQNLICNYILLHNTLKFSIWIPQERRAKFPFTSFFSTYIYCEKGWSQWSKQNVNHHKNTCLVLTIISHILKNIHNFQAPLYCTREWTINNFVHPALTGEWTFVAGEILWPGKSERSSICNRQLSWTGVKGIYSSCIMVNISKDSASHIDVISWFNNSWICKLKCNCPYFPYFSAGI